MKMHQLFFPNGFEKTKVRWEKIKIKLAHNVLRLCVCLPLTQCFNLPKMLMGQIAQNRCYTLGGIIAQMLN
jgi:hypothetical protein